MCAMTNSDDRSTDRFQNAPLTDSYRFTVDEGDDVVVSIAEEIANVHGCGPTDLKPLYFDVDVETLERVVDGPNQHEFHFVSNGIAVIVSGCGKVVFEPAEC